LSLHAFGQQPVLQALKRLAAEKVTIIVGAGASVESGLPTWGDLVSTLLRTAAFERGLSTDDAQLFATWTQQKEGLTAAGEMARRLLKDFRSALRSGLYGQTSSPLPGAGCRYFDP
jgi:hypothetical protein